MLDRRFPLLKPEESHKFHPWIKLYTDAIDPSLAVLSGVQQQRKDPSWANLLVKAVSEDPAIAGTSFLYSVYDCGGRVSGDFGGWVSDKTHEYFRPVHDAVCGVSDKLERRSEIIRIAGNDPRPVTLTPNYLLPLDANPWLLDVVANLLGRTDFVSIRSENKTGRVSRITMSKVGKHPFAFVSIKDTSPETGNITGLLKVGADGEYGHEIIGSLDRSGVNPAFFHSLFEKVPVVVQDMAEYQRLLTAPALSLSAQRVAYQNRWLKPLLAFMADNKVEITDLFEKESHDRGTSINVIANYACPREQERTEGLTLWCFNPEKRTPRSGWLNPIVQQVWASGGDEYPLRSLLHTFKPALG